MKKIQNLSDEEFIELYYLTFDKVNDRMILQMRSDYAVLSERLHEIILNYRRYDFNQIIPLKKLIALRNRIKQAIKSQTPSGYYRYILARISNQRRIKIRDALFAALLIEYSLFADDWKNKYIDLLSKSVLEMYEFTAEETGIDITIARDIQINQNIVLNGLGDNLNGLVAADIEYRVREIIKVVGQSGDYEIILQRGIKALINKTATGNHTGIFVDFGQHVISDHRIQALIDANVDKVIFIAVLDNATTDICRSLNGFTFKVSELIIGKNMPPIRPPKHPCRSVVRPWTYKKI